MSENTNTIGQFLFATLAALVCMLSNVWLYIHTGNFCWVVGITCCAACAVFCLLMLAIQIGEGR
jgi:hypothetical protein